MTLMKYTWIKGEPCITAVVFDDEVETTELFSLPDLWTVIDEMRELKILRKSKGKC